MLRAMVVGSAVLMAASAATAQGTARTCAAEPVTARGEPARFEVLARTKARANWRARVRATPGLGNVFSNWARAAQTEERCISGPGGTVCTLKGTPCR